MSYDEKLYTQEMISDAEDIYNRIKVLYPDSPDKGAMVLAYASAVVAVKTEDAHDGAKCLGCLINRIAEANRLTSISALHLAVKDIKTDG